MRTPKEIVQVLWLARVSDLEFQKELEREVTLFRGEVLMSVLEKLEEANNVEILEPNGVETEYGKGFSAGVQEGWNSARDKIITAFNITAG